MNKTVFLFLLVAFLFSWAYASLDTGSLEDRMDKIGGATAFELLKQQESSMGD
jgi:hypothetical protein